MRETVDEADARVQTANLSATVAVDPVDAEGGQLPWNVHRPARYRSGLQSIWLPACTPSSLKRQFNHRILFRVL
jgi:hypothetical protein